MFDKSNLFSEDQALTTEGSVASTNYIDLGLVNMGEGEPLELIVQVTEAFATATSLKVVLQADDNSSFSSPESVLDSGAIATASLVAGYQFKFSSLPINLQRYVRLSYTTVGTPSAGKLFAGLGIDRNTWRAMADAL